MLCGSWRLTISYLIFVLACAVGNLDFTESLCCYPSLTVKILSTPKRREEMEQGFLTQAMEGSL